MYKMNALLILCVLFFGELSFAETDLYPRGCIYIDGICDSECEVGTHAYTTGCGYLKPEPTCGNPTPVTATKGMICDFSACYCDHPTVRNEVTRQCVPLDECPK